MQRCQRYSLLLLAGGKSSRMGSNKAELLYEGRTFLAHILEKARALGIEKCYVSGYASDEKEVITVWDQFPDRGPLGGIHACMQVMDTPYCLVLPVDTPKLPVEILERLLCEHEKGIDREKVLIWEHGDRQEPLIAIYPVVMKEMIEELIQEQSAPVFRALGNWGYISCRLEMEKEEIINVNTPELYKKILNQ